MRKIINAISVPVLAAAFAVSFVGVSTVSAQQSCDDITITNTGAGSVNEVTCANDYTITIECKNDTQIVIDVSQDSESGSATVSQNTTVGGAQTGDAVNINDIDAFIENNNCLEDEEEEEVVTPPVVVETEEPSAPTPVGGGEVLAAETEAAALPATGETSVLQTALVSTIALVSAVVVTKAGLAFSKR